MSNSDGENKRAPRSELVDKIYAGALNPADYRKIFAAWDRHFELVLDSEDGSLVEDFDWAQEFVSHFERAGEVFDRIGVATTHSVSEIVELASNAALACRDDGRIIHANQHAARAIGTPIPGSVLELPLDSNSEQLLKDLINRIPPLDSPTARVALRLFPDTATEPIVLVAHRVADPELKNNAILIQSVTAAWGEEIEQTLLDAFSLTQAEVELVASLYRGYSIREISDWKGRSQATLRSQLSSVLQKTSTKTQSALMRIVVGLVHMVLHRDTTLTPKGKVRLVKERAQRSGVIDLTNGLSLEYVESGDLGGRPFFFVQPTTTPTLTDDIVEELCKRELRLISPVRSGCGRTTRAPTSYLASDWATHYVELADALGFQKIVCGGHCSGGVYALELARALQSRCAGVLLVDFGAPLEGASMIYTMPASPRRLFLASRYFPRAAVTPIKYVAADFHSGPDGETRAVDYFYDGSPTDEAMLHQADHWRITRDNIAYCFQNVPQLAHDVAQWSRDHSTLVKAVAEFTPVRFLIGQQNLMMKPEYIEAFCNRVPNTSHQIVEGQAQLLIYARPSVLAEEAGRLWDNKE